MEDLTVFGMKIVPHRLVPETQPNYRVKRDLCSPAFEAEMDRWCDEFFGRSPFFLVVDPKAAGYPFGKVIYAHPLNVDLLNEEFSRRGFFPSGGKQS